MSKKISAIAHAVALVWIFSFCVLSAYPDSKRPPPGENERTLRAVKVVTPPKLDGFLEPEIWDQALAATNFIQKQPDEGAPASEATEVRILYDDKNLYIGVMCFDSEPEKIIATEKKRDSEQIKDNDHIQLLFDTFRDRRNGYVFITNPLGARLELQVRREGENEGSRYIKNPNLNDDWNGVWEVKATIDERGWSAEIEIDLKTLRFEEHSKNGWGLNILRNIRRKNEISTWAPLPRNLELYKISLAGDLIGLEELKKGLNLQVKPYIMASRISERAEEGMLSSDNSLDAGLDMKYGLTSNLTFELTVNPDYSQVEVDDEQINLTRFSLFFPEKREFFLENAALFNIGSSEDAMIFYSRSIGISEDREEIPLFGGVKLAGKLGRFNLGLYSIQSQKTGDIPSNNFSVVRMSRDILGKSAVGFMVANRQSTGSSGDYNRSFAVDGDFVFGRNLSISGYFALTSTPHLKGKNKAGKLRFHWVSDYWELFGHYFDIQENFNPEMGFVKRTGIRHFQFHTAFTPEPDIPGLRRLNPHVRFDYLTDQDKNLLWRKMHIDFAGNLLNGGFFSLAWNGEHEFVDVPFPIQDDIVILVGIYDSSWWLARAGSNKSRSLWTDSNYRWGGFYGGTGKIWNIKIGWRPFFSLGTEVGFTHNNIDLVQGEFKSHVLSTRIIYNFSTRLALMSLIQWNSDTGEVSANIRLDFIHTLGSNLYIVYNERRLVEESGKGILDRSLAIKFTYLFNF
ncbi:DUF5916 domain-containing protein [Acidobacteriota bacterium]